MIRPLILLLLLANGPATLKVDVNVTPSVNVPPPVTPPTPARGDPNSALGGILAGQAAGIGTGIAIPQGHTLRACTPNLTPEQSAWKVLLEQADGQLCCMTKVAS